MSGQNSITQTQEPKEVGLAELIKMWIEPDKCDKEWPIKDVELVSHTTPPYLVVTLPDETVYHVTIMEVESE